MSEHTPGPWTAWYQGSGDYLISSKEGGELGSFYGEANAQLIAAAPAMLKVLQETVQDALDGNGGPNWDDFNAVIAKATGEQE